MTPNDIEVGARYKVNLFGYENSRFLGIGRRRLYTINKYEEKHLVIIEGVGVGQMVQEGENAMPYFWENIVRTA